MRLREENPALFRAVNLLKKNSFIFRDVNRDEYDTLLQQTEEANNVLSYDDCAVKIMSDYGVIKIVLLDDLEDGMNNNLRATFTANETKVYVACWQIWAEQYISQGPMVATTLDAIANRMDELGFKLTGGLRGPLKDALQTLKRRSLVRFRTLDPESITITPAVSLILDRDGLTDFHDTKIALWLNQRSEKEKEDAGENAE